MYNVSIRSVGSADLVTPQQYIIIMESCYIVWILLSICGIVSNIINIKTFIIMGVGDGVTVSLLALSIFDLLYVITSQSIGFAAIFDPCIN
ncbi:hypothetical protein BsWGS_12760 [Bradybaena similaris]